jgi:hypothetical protein
MAIQSLPSYATIVLEGYSESLAPAMHRSEFEDGYVRQDAKITRRRVVRSAKMRICTVEDVRDFKCWMRDSLRNGALWWLYKDPVEGRELRARFVNGNVTFKPMSQVREGSANIWTADCEIESWY